MVDSNPNRWGVVAVFYGLEAKAEYRVLKGYVIGEPYDYGSVMHYGFNFFSVDSKKPIIIKLMPGGKQMGQRDGFSGLDLRKINKFYNCTKYISKWSLLCANNFWLVRNFFKNQCAFHRLLYLTIFAEAILTPKKEKIKIVSGMGSVLGIRTIFIPNHNFLVRFEGILGEFGQAMVRILGRHSHSHFLGQLCPRGKKKNDYDYGTIWRHIRWVWSSHGSYFGETYLYSNRNTHGESKRAIRYLPYPNKVKWAWYRSHITSGQ